uniref:Peptidyl-prolyl cis-trans isomerase E n=1 Tax=Zea mays TaxID=4577 RepID=B6TZZ3_MAIZE|nr:peptidyl-prolyl cis-trans isomerase E [Zea mays]
MNQPVQKNTLYVGGLAEEVDEKILHAAFVPFGEVKLFGRVLTVNYAFPERIKGGEQGWAAQPIWADADTWFERQQQEEEMQRLQAEHRAAMQAAEKLHREKLAAEREGEKEEDPMAAAEAQAVKQSS